MQRYEAGGDEALQDLPRLARQRVTTEAEDAEMIATHSQDPFHRCRDTAIQYAVSLTRLLYL